MMMFKRLFAALAVLAVAACGGGGGNAGTSPLGPNNPGGGTAPAAADLILVLSAGSVANTGTETVVATATAIDANRNTVAGVPVTITVNNNGVVSPQSAVTDDAGKLNATIGIGSDQSNRTLTVTATSGAITRTASLQVQDTGGGGGTAPSDLLLTLSSPTIGNSGAQTVTATATALDARRNVMPGVVVSISVDAGATAAPSGTSTNASGVVSAAIGIGGNPTNRTITVTATAPGLTPRTASLQVVNSTTTVPIASDLIVALSSNSLVNGGSSTITATITAVDANRNALSGIPVLVSVDGNAVANVSGQATNSSGVVTATIGVGADRSNRSVTVTASSGSITRSATFTVTGATLTASFSPTVTTGSAGNQIEYRLVDANSSPMVGQTVAVTATGGLPAASGTTDANGKYVYTYDAPTSAGSITITATAAGDTRSQTVAVQAPGTTPPNATQVPQSASLTPTPSVVTVNTVGSTTNQAELRALFLGANNQPVQNVRVRFDLDGNANGSDGTVTVAGGGAIAYSDATGVARGTFTAGQRSSPTNGVSVRACWDVTDFAAGTCPNAVRSTLTVTSEALAVNIRTNNLIKIGPAGLTYIKEFVVMVVDAAGQAKADVLITPSVDLTAYYKGIYFWDAVDERWVQSMRLAADQVWTWDAANQRWSQGAANGQQQCPNEDVNRNGVREAPAFPGSSVPAVTGRQEDLNWNGDLDPRKSDVAIKMVGSARTDANGLAVVQIEYGQNLASWVDYVITVTASGVSGTESRARYAGLFWGVGNLPYPSAAVTSETLPPAFVISPYGRGAVSIVNGQPTPAGVCTDSN